MAKRKEPDTPSKTQSTPSKRSRKQPDHLQDTLPLNLENANTTPSRKKSVKPLSTNGISTPSKEGKNGYIGHSSDQEEDENDDLTPKPNGTTLFATPSKRRVLGKSTPSQSAKADRSAKRKSAQALIGAQEDGIEWDNSAALAQAILDEAENIVQSTEQQEGQTIEADSSSAPVTPSKRSRGRPKGAKNKRSPTPEGDLPPEERYFFQNRTGPTQISANSFAQLGLLSHDEYFDSRRHHKQNHESERAYLMRLHARAFPQWKFELDEGFSICMYGYGSKRKLMNNFAEWLYPELERKSKVIVLNGYTTRINIRNVLNTIGNTLVGKDQEMRLVGQPHDMLDTILAHLTDHFQGQLVVMVNSIDSAALRKSSSQSILARLAAHSKVRFIASADTPTFPILWNSALKDQFRFAFHDCTTFAPYELEISPVDDVNELLGRKNRRVGGKEGVGFVLKSLPENARNLYRVLLTEILTIINDGAEYQGDDEEIEAERKGQNGGNAEDIGIEYRALYQKASEEFICSSDMNFRFLLKEFHDHQMLTSRRDASGTEMLAVPLQRDEMEAVLEDLVIG